MSREILQRVYLEFDEEDKGEVLELLKKLFEVEYEIYNESENHYNIEFNNSYYEEKDFKELKEICDNIDLAEYKYCEGEGFIWNKEDKDDELQKIVKKKLRQIKKN